MPIGRAGLRAYGPGVPSRRLIYTGAVALIATGTGVAIHASDAGQKVYSLVEASANVGVGGLRGAFPAASRAMSAVSSAPKYLGPYSIVRRTREGRIDATFGDKGYAGDFPNSTDSGYKYTSLCIDPGSALGYKSG
jgi:hypothetical protein